ncbi:MAG: SGNH/GDSL hydrolase family protein, partial [Lentisphaeria bacterium]|nr:SGNH/GDSL hydrolase family protein [Lentisphaeria bacterium]
MNVKKLIAILSVSLCAMTLSAGELKIKSGDTLAFMGDSITAGGWGHAQGYCKLVGEALKYKKLDVKTIGAGISGHKSNQMNARMQRDVIDKKATWMTLSCGINDVWHGPRGISLEQYKKEVAELADKADKAGVKLMILSATIFERDPMDGAKNAKLAPYNAFLKEFAAKRGYIFVDLNTPMWEVVKQHMVNGKITSTVVTSDGVHMTPRGYKMMARGILKGFGMTDAEVDEIDREVWRKMPNT